MAYTKEQVTFISDRETIKKLKGRGLTQPCSPQSNNYENFDEKKYNSTMKKCFIPCESLLINILVVNIKAFLEVSTWKKYLENHISSWFIYTNVLLFIGIPTVFCVLKKVMKFWD